MAAGAKHQAALSTQKVQTVQTPLEEKHLNRGAGPLFAYLYVQQHRIFPHGYLCYQA